MNIIEISKQPLDTVWFDAKTFLFVFDNNGKQIADYDLSSGLKLISDKKNMTIFIYDEDLIPGKWKFLGTKLIQKNNKLVEEKISADGYKEGKLSKRKYDNKNPWDIAQLGTFNESINQGISVKEREKRINICRDCPFFIHEDGICSINNDLVIQTTKLKYEYCPEEKWGNKEESIEYKLSLKQRSPNADDIIITNQAMINNKEQITFENELEEYLKGL